MTVEFGGWDKTVSKGRRVRKRRAVESARDGAGGPAADALL